MWLQGRFPFINCLQNPQALAGARSACRGGRAGAVEVPVVATVIESRMVFDSAALPSSTLGCGGPATKIWGRSCQPSFWASVVVRLTVSLISSAPILSGSWMWYCWSLFNGNTSSILKIEIWDV